MSTEGQAYIAYDKDDCPYLQWGKYVLYMDLDMPDEEEMEKARIELRETPEIKESALKEFRALLRAETDLHVQLDSDYFLIKFLRPCKFYPKSALNLIKNYYKYLYKYPEFTADLYPSNVESVFAKGIIELLPTRSNGTRMMLCHAARWNPDEVDLNTCIKAVLMMTEVAMDEPRTQIHGVHVLADMAGLAFKHIRLFKPWHAKLIMEALQKCLPIRLKGIHSINEPSYYKILYLLFKPFMIKKIDQRLHFHGRKYDKLVEIIGADHLPTTFGGNMYLPPLNGQLMADMLKQYDTEFKMLGQYGYKKKPTNK